MTGSELRRRLYHTPDQDGWENLASEAIDRVDALEAALAPFAASVRRNFPDIDLAADAPLGWHPDAAVFVRATVAECRAVLAAASKFGTADSLT